MSEDAEMSQNADKTVSTIHHPDPLNHNPNPPVVYTEPRQPPAAGPYDYSHPYLPAHRGIGVQAAHNQTQAPVSECWVAEGASPLKHPLPVPNPQPTTSTSPNSIHSPSSRIRGTNDDTNKALKKTRASQSVRCDVCKIDCNSKDVFEMHIMGKKHQKKAYAYTTPASVPGTMNAMGENLDAGASDGAIGADLETKRCKVLNEGAPANSVRVCTLCNVVCNSQAVFNTHLSGRKHALQAGLRANDGTQPWIDAVVRSSWCEVCKVNCPDVYIYSQHMSGKKHRNKTENLEVSKQENPIIGPVENPSGSGGEKLGGRCSPEDLKMKKRKAGEVWMCMLCNIACNSESVFGSHLSGQKHRAKAAVAHPS